MRAQKVVARDFQFYFSDLDNIILVECHEDERVTVRASKNNVPDERKIFFIRKLAAEGFIPDNYQWFSGPMDGSNDVLWIKDYSWLEKTQQAVTRKANRIMGPILVAACILWLAMIRVLIVSDHHQTIAKSNLKSPPAASLVSRQPLAQLEREHQAVTENHAAGNPPLRAAVVEQHRANELNQDQRN
jgi:hypothetical protein